MYGKKFKYTSHTENDQVVLAHCVGVIAVLTIFGAHDSLSSLKDPCLYIWSDPLFCF